jgi:hypothetical protein
MSFLLGKLWLVLALCLSVGFAAGCAQFKNPLVDSEGRWFTYRDKDDKKDKDAGPKIPTPRQRMEEMKETVKKVEKKELTPEQQETYAVHLAQVIRDEDDPLIRQQILRTLAVFPGTTSSDVLTAGIKDNDRDVRVTCCEAWGKRKGPEATQILSGAATSDTDIDVRLAALRGLGEVGDVSVVPTLGTALENSDPAVQHRAVESLKKVTGKKLGDDVDAWREYVQTGQPPAKPSFFAKYIPWLSTTR